MPSALIADDEPHLAQYLKDQLNQLWPELEIVYTARNGVDAARQLAALQPDVAFLDIQMPGLSGLEVAQGIEGATRTVFVTAYDEYAVQAFDQAALDYLLKPFRTERLALSVQRIKTALASASSAEDASLAQALHRLQAPVPASMPRLRYVRAAHGALTHQIAVDDIMYFHADDKYTVVHTASGEYVIRTTITELAAQLDAGQFWQVHRSTLVNLDHLAGTRRDENSRLFLRMKGLETELPVSRAYVHMFKAM